MAISRVHTWSSGEVLTASDLNAEFNNFINNSLALVSPLTGSLDFGSNAVSNFVFEKQSATQSVGVEGFAYWQSTEDCLHISTGTIQARVPALTAIQAGDLILVSNPSGVEGATVYARLPAATSSTQLLGLSSRVPTYIPAATSANQFLGVDAAGTDVEYKTLAAGSGVTITHSPKAVTIAATSTSPFSSSFTSGTLTLAAASAFSVAHGLGAIPTLVQLRAQCVSAEDNYSVGDEVVITGTMSEVNASGHGVTWGCNATAVFAAVGTSIHLNDKSTGGDAGALTEANWRWVVRAWL